MARRRRARENPITTRNKVLIGVGGGAALVGLIYLLTRSKEEKKDSGAAASIQNGAQPGSTISPGPKVSMAPAPPPPPPSRISTVAPTTFSPINTSTVSWVQGPNP